MMPLKEYQRRWEIVFLGDSGVGKTSFLRLKSAGTPVTEPIAASVGYDFLNLRFSARSSDGSYELGYFDQLRIWDTSGRERAQDITSSLLPRADALLIFIDLSRKLGTQIDRWRTLCEQYSIPVDRIYWVGNKYDRCESPSAEGSLEKIREALGESTIHDHCFATSLLRDGSSGLSLFLDVIHQHLARSTCTLQTHPESAPLPPAPPPPPASTNNRQPLNLVSPPPPASSNRTRSSTNKQQVVISSSRAAAVEQAVLEITVEPVQVRISVTYGSETFNIIRIEEKLDGKNKSEYDGTYVKEMAYDRIKSCSPNDYTKDDGVFFLKMLPQKRSKAVEGFAEMALGEMISGMMKMELIPEFYWDCFSPASIILLPNHAGKGLLQPFAIGSKPLHQAPKKYDHILILHPNAAKPVSIPENRIVVQLLEKSKGMILTVYWNEADIIKHKSLTETTVSEIIKELRIIKDTICMNSQLVDRITSIYKLTQKKKPTFEESKKRFFSNQGYEVYYNSIDKPSHGLSYVLMIMILFGNYSVHSGNIQLTLESEKATYTGIDYGAGLRNLGDSHAQTNIWQALEELTKVRTFEALKKLRPHRFFTKRYLEYYKIPGLFESVQKHAKTFLEELKADHSKKRMLEQVIVESLIKSYENYNDASDETKRTDLLKYVYGDYYPIYAVKRRESAFDVCDFAEDIYNILYERLREMAHQKVPVLINLEGKRQYKSITASERRYIEEHGRPEFVSAQLKSDASQIKAGAREAELVQELWEDSQDISTITAAVSPLSLSSAFKEKMRALSQATQFSLESSAELITIQARKLLPTDTGYQLLNQAERELTELTRDYAERSSEKYSIHSENNGRHRFWSVQGSPRLISKIDKEIRNISDKKTTISTAAASEENLPELGSCHIS